MTRSTRCVPYTLRLALLSCPSGEYTCLLGVVASTCIGFTDSETYRLVMILRYMCVLALRMVGSWPYPRLVFAADALYAATSVGPSTLLVEGKVLEAGNKGV